MEQEHADLEHGRGGLPYYETMRALRDSVRAGLARTITVPPENVALTSSTTSGLQHRRRRPAAAAGRRDRHLGHRALRPSGCAERLGGPGTRRAGAGDPGRARTRFDPRRGDAEDPPGRALARFLADRQRASRRGGPGRHRRADPGRRRTVGRRRRRRGCPVRLLRRLRAEMAVRSGCDRRAVRPRSRAPPCRLADVLLAGELRRRRRVYTEGGGGQVRRGLDPDCVACGPGGRTGHRAPLGLHTIRQSRPRAAGRGSPTVSRS